MFKVIDLQTGEFGNILARETGKVWFVYRFVSDATGVKERDVELLDADGPSVADNSTSKHIENDCPKAPCKGKWHSLSHEFQKQTFCGLCGDTGLSS